MSPQEILGAWHVTARRLLPAGVAVWDAHTHTGGNDPDGRAGDALSLLGALADAGHAGAVVMTSAEPSGYRAANDRVLAEAEAAGGRLIPFCRVDPREGREAAAEATRSLDRGHRGIKLHPRTESFTMDHPGVAPVLRVAAERRVPVLVHAGRGITPLGDACLAHLAAIDGLNLVLAHCAISDLAVLGPIAGDVAGLYFDTAWWDVTDRLALMAIVPPSRVLYASDTPYGWPDVGFVMTMRTAQAARYIPGQLAALFGGTLRALLDGRRPADDRPGLEETVLAVDTGLLRAHASLHGAIAAALRGGDVGEALSLSRLAVAGVDHHAHQAVFAAVAATLAAVATPVDRTAISLMIVAAHATLTWDVPVPDLG